ncbi:MAG: protein kinase domain-containing protein [Vicinamibacterales bacterium]
MRCRECNADLPAEARFCLSCGVRVEPAAPDKPADPLRESLERAIGFQYRIERLLGRGGMGAVYLAHELALDRDVAIKVLPPEQANTPELRERFTREARTAARLNHPNIVPLYTFGEVAGLMYFVMGYVNGESLADRLHNHRALDSESARSLIVMLCDALDYAHHQGIVHRDIKPDNILIDAASDTPRLTDFGIAKTMLGDAHLTTAKLTTAGQLVGTPHYMSPEQAMGQPEVGSASDIYSLGVVAYEIVSGRRPFEGDNPMDVLAQRLMREPRSLGEIAGGAPADLTQPIMRCLERDPAKRWPDARSLREALMPSEEEVEYSPTLRVLKTLTTVILPIAALAFVYWNLFGPLNRDAQQGVDRVTTMFRGGIAGLMLVVIAIIVRLRLEGMDARTIALKAMQQPNWWRAWYPRGLRRRGDVWDRLPRAVRRFRTLKGLLLTYIFAAFLPVGILGGWQDRVLALRLGLFAGVIGGVALMFASRGAAGREIRANTGVTSAEASALLNTPTWRISTWRRPPAALMLARSAVTPDATAAAASPGEEEATRL